MIIAQVKMPEKDAEMILKVITKLGGQIQLVDPVDYKVSSEAKRTKKDLETAFKEIKLHQEGKIQLKTAQELIDEL